MRKQFKQSAVAAAIYFLTAISANAQKSDKSYPFDMPQVMLPAFRQDTFNIKNFGAINDGKTLNTQAFENAIDACSKAGGGTVLIPEGLWLTGPIKLKSKVNLHTEKGALVLFSRNLEIYPLVKTNYEGLNTMRCQSPISGLELEDIAITGEGIFDGSGHVWRPVKRSKLTDSQWESLVNSGGVVGKDKNTWFPSEKAMKGYEMNSSGYLGPNATEEDYMAIRDFLRPVMVSLVRCKRVLIDGVTFQNSPSWCLHPLMCEHLSLKGVKVYNPWYAQNGDGIDVESCRIGQIDNCTFDAGDDAICIKSGKNEEGRKRNMPTELFVITNCVVYHAHGGFVIGSEMSGGARNLYVNNCTFIGTDVGLRFKTTRGRGGIVEKIYISNISMIDIPTDAIGFNMFYEGTSPLPEADEKQPSLPQETVVIPKVDEGTPQFKDFYIENVTCYGAERAILIQGLPEMAISNINLKNISINGRYGISCIDANQINCKNIKLDISKGNILYIKNSKNVNLKNIKGNGNTGKLLKVNGKDTENINISGIGTNFSDADIELGSEVKIGAIVKK
jgi:DNA sulfur modification protein DndE